MKDDKNNKLEWSALWDELKGRIREFYPYFLGFYILCLLIAAFSRTWRGFFYWPGFHGWFVFFTVVFLTTFRLKFSLPKINIYFRKPDLSSGRRLVNRLNDIIRSLLSFALKFGTAIGQLGLRITFSIFNRLREITWRGWLKILVVASVLIMAIWQEVNSWELLTIFYAALSILYIFDSRLSAGAALIYLTACPLLLWLDRPSLAESAAVYAFYFLVITVATQMRELRQDQARHQPD